MLPRSLAPLLLFKQRPELLVLGCGQRTRRPTAELTQARVACQRSLHGSVLMARCLQFLRERGIALECIDTPNAAATFNVLAQEGRRVAGALIPPDSVESPQPDAPVRGRAVPKRSSTGPLPNWRDREMV